MVFSAFARPMSPSLSTSMSVRKLSSIYKHQWGTQWWRGSECCESSHRLPLAKFVVDPHGLLHGLEMPGQKTMSSTLFSLCV